MYTCCKPVYKLENFWQFLIPNYLQNAGQNTSYFVMVHELASISHSWNTDITTQGQAPFSGGCSGQCFLPSGRCLQLRCLTASVTCRGQCEKESGQGEEGGRKVYSTVLARTFFHPANLLKEWLHDILQVKKTKQKFLTDW